MSYAIIRLGGKQYKVQEGEQLLVDRLKTEAGATFQPDLLFVPEGDGTGVTVTARVLDHVKGDKIRIGKYRRRTGYKRHTGFRASLTQIEIESIGMGRAASKKAEEPAKAAARAVPEPKAPEPKAADHLAGLPEGYAELTVPQVSAAAKTWDRPALDAALAYEQGHAGRKGALAALESAIAATEEAD